MLKRRGFTAVAVITLALGIGANTAIFTLINAVVLKPLPVTNPDELVLFNDSPSEGTRSLDGDIRAGRWDHFSYASYRYFREHDRSFQELSAFRSGEIRQCERTEANRARLPDGPRATSCGKYFAVLEKTDAGARPKMKTTRPRPSCNRYSHGYWKQN